MNARRLSVSKSVLGEIVNTPCCFIHYLTMKDLKEHIEEQQQMLIESKADEISNAIKESIKNGEELDEGFFGTLLGGVAGMTAGAAIMKAVCKTLGIEKGLIFDLLTSKVVCAAAGAAIGNNLTRF